MIDSLFEFYQKIHFDGFNLKFGKPEEMGYNDDDWQMPFKEVYLDNKLKEIENPTDYILVMADTHDDIEKTQDAISKIVNLGVGVVIHAGDFVHKDFLVEMLSRNPDIDRVFAVLGNHDKPNSDMVNIHQELGDDGVYRLLINYNINRFTYNSKKFVLYHGDDLDKLTDLTDDDMHDWNFLIYGHWHTPSFFYREYITHKNDYNCVINPGSAYSMDMGGKPGTGYMLLLNTEDVFKSFYVNMRPNNEEEMSAITKLHMMKNTIVFNDDNSEQMKELYKKKQTTGA